MEEWADLTDGGMSNDQAWELIREKYLFLPKEPGAMEESEEEEMSTYQLHLEAQRLLKQVDEIKQERALRGQETDE